MANEKTKSNKSKIYFIICTLKPESGLPPQIDALLSKDVSPIIASWIEPLRLETRLTRTPSIGMSIIACPPFCDLALEKRIPC